MKMHINSGPNHDILITQLTLGVNVYHDAQIID